MKFDEQPDRCYFFDLDGTLVDSLPGIESSVRAALLATDRTFEGGIGHLIGPPIRQVLRRIIQNEPEPELDRVEAQFRKYYDAEGWKGSNLYPGVEPTLRELKNQGNRLFVFTNKPAHVTSAILRELDISSCFEAILSRDSRVPHFENKGAMLSDLLRNFEVDKDSALVIGDSREDYQAALATGISFCFVTYGYGDLPEELNLECVSQIDSFCKLLSISM